MSKVLATTYKVAYTFPFVLVTFIADTLTCGGCCALCKQAADREFLEASIAKGGGRGAPNPSNMDDGDEDIDDDAEQQLEDLLREAIKAKGPLSLPLQDDIRVPKKSDATLKMERAKNREDFNREMQEYKKLTVYAMMHGTPRPAPPQPRVKFAAVTFWTVVLSNSVEKGEALVTNPKFELFMDLVKMNGSTRFTFAPARELKRLQTISKASVATPDFESKLVRSAEIPQDVPVLFVSHKWIDGHPDHDGEILTHIRESISDDTLVWLDAFSLRMFAQDVLSSMMLFVQLKELREATNVTFYRPTLSYDLYAKSAWCQTEEFVFKGVRHDRDPIANVFNIYDFVIMGLLVKWASEVSYVKASDLPAYYANIKNYLELGESRGNYAPDSDWWDTVEVPPF